MTGVHLLDEVVRTVAPLLADLDIERHKRSLAVPGERGDRVLAALQRSAGSRAGTAVFYVNLSLNPVPWVAWKRRETPADVRATSPGEGEGVLWARLAGPAPAGAWEVTAETLDPVCVALAAALRAELTANWLPLLSRPRLKEMLRSRDARPPGVVADGRIGALLCDIEDMPATDRAGLAAFFDKRAAEGEPELGELAQWLRMAFP